METTPNKYLQQIGNRRPFTVPEGYFTGVAETMDAIAAPTAGRKNAFFVPRKWLYGAAASLVGIVLLGQMYRADSENRRHSADAYEAYVLSQVNESSLIDFYLASDTE